MKEHKIMAIVAAFLSLGCVVCCGFIVDLGLEEMADPSQYRPHLIWLPPAFMEVALALMCMGAAIKLWRNK